ncbi:major capsid protein [Streptomyces sp. NPDC057302]|uniref:major capsid protein n=1 Tax=Streptomyces sp. NPDC057302 TaxID=3346094 RepID=UPI00363372DB
MNREQLNSLLQRLAEADASQRTELINEAIASHGAEEVAALVETGLEAGREIVDAESRSDEDVTNLELVTEIVEAARTRGSEITQAEEARQQKIADLHGRLNPQSDTAESEGEGAEPAAEAASTVGEAGAGAEGTGATGEAVPNDASSITEGAPATVAASRRPATTNFGALQSDRTGAQRGSNWSLTASADIPGYSTGQELTFDQLIDAATRRMQGLARIGRSNADTGGVNIAQFNLTRESNLVARNEQDHRVLDYAADERRLPGGSLVAACATGTVAQGDVWCSPSDTLWEFCPDLATREGMLDVPTITVRHGGIRWPKTPNFADVYKKLDDMTWDWTDEEVCDPDKRPAVKPCAELPCPDWAELRLRPRGMCIKADILRNHSWPEQVRDWTQRLLVAHEHKINHDTIAAMVKGADKTIEYKSTGGDDGTVNYGPGATAGLLGALEFQIEQIRNANRMGRTAALEVVMPHWVHGVIRSDLAKRQGVDLLDVSDQRINKWFTDRHARVQYVYDWQDLDSDSVLTWPTTLQILIYTAGAYVSARQDIISLDSIYDSVNLLGRAAQTGPPVVPAIPGNKFISLFTEEAHLLGRKCGVSRLIKIDLCADGATTGGAVPAMGVTCPAV